MSRVLVTGAGTPLGDAVLRRLLADPAWEVRALTADVPPRWLRESCEARRAELRDGHLCGSPLDGCSHVVCCGPAEPGVVERARLPYTAARDATVLAPALVREALEGGVERYLHVATPLAADRAGEFPTSEAEIAATPPPTSALALGCLAVEQLCRAARDEHGLPLTICRPFGGYGPGERAGPAPGSAHVVADLIDRALAGERPLRLLGDGGQKRTLTPFGDLAEGIVAALAADGAGGLELNVAGPWELTVDELAGLVWRACGNAPDELELEHLPAPEGDVRRRCPASELIRAKTGWEASTAPEAGIAATVAWYRASEAGEPGDPAL